MIYQPSKRLSPALLNRLNSLECYVGPLQLTGVFGKWRFAVLPCAAGLPQWIFTGLYWDRSEGLRRDYNCLSNRSPLNLAITRLDRQLVGLSLSLSFSLALTLSLSFSLCLSLSLSFFLSFFLTFSCFTWFSFSHSLCFNSYFLPAIVLQACLSLSIPTSLPKTIIILRYGFIAENRSAWFSIFPSSPHTSASEVLTCICRA